MQILSDENFLMMYCLEDSYLWQCKKQMFEILDKTKDSLVFNDCNLIREFKKYLAGRKKKDEQINQLFKNESHLSDS